MLGFLYFFVFFFRGSGFSGSVLIFCLFFFPDEDLLTVGVYRPIGRRDTCSERVCSEGECDRLRIALRDGLTREVPDVLYSTSLNPTTECEVQLAYVRCRLTDDRVIFACDISLRLEEDDREAECFP